MKKLSAEQMAKNLEESYTKSSLRTVRQAHQLSAEIENLIGQIASEFPAQGKLLERAQLLIEEVRDDFHSLSH